MSSHKQQQDSAFHIFVRTENSFALDSLADLIVVLRVSPIPNDFEHNHCSISAV